MKERDLYRIFMSLLLAVALVGVYTGSALAIGPGTGGSRIRIDNEEIGPYKLLVATSPLPVTVGQMSVWVRVTGLEDDGFRRDAQVRIEATPREGGAMLTGQGAHQNAGNDYDYVAHLAVDQTGQWDVTVYIEDELGEAEVAFTETVTRGFSAATLISLAIPFIVLAVIVGVYLWRRSGE